MRLLLDTHVFLWLLSEPQRLGEELAVVADPRNELIVSAASSWEIALKHAIGELELPEQPARFVPERIRAIGATPLAIEHVHALGTCELPSLHRDPFDRLLISQAVQLRLRIVTADRQVAAYPVDSLLVG